MDVSLYWSGDWPPHLAPLLAALEQLDDSGDLPEGSVALCPDATAVSPPASGPCVAGVFAGQRLVTPQGRAELRERLVDWRDRDTVFFTPTRTAAEALRSMLGLSPERVVVVPLPLPSDRRPSEPVTGGDDVVALAPISQTHVSARRALGMMARRNRMVMVDPAAASLGRAGGLAGYWDLMAGHDLVALEDADAALRGAAVVVASETGPELGWTLRSALATGVPVVAPSTGLVHDHLAAVGAQAYLYLPDPGGLSMAEAIAAALDGARGEDVPARAREAVLVEDWADAALKLVGALVEAVRPAAAESAPVEASVTSESLTIGVLNPHTSGGGGERFLRELVGAMARHGSRPRVKLACAVDPDKSFDAGADALARAGVEVQMVAVEEFGARAAAELGHIDVAWCSWPHLTDPPHVTAPLAATFHDFNWKHFDVMTAQQKAVLDRQTPAWIERSKLFLHSSDFIRSELERFYPGAPVDTRVIPLTVEAEGEPVSDEERERVRTRFSLPESFFLSPAGRHLHKNYPALIGALRLLRERGRPVSVVATGAVTDVYNGPDLIGLGYVTARELSILYDLSRGMVQTSLYEAGSWPMWEAMAAHRPVAISRIPSVVEYVDKLDTPVEFFDPLAPESIADALAGIVDGSPVTDPATIERSAAAVTARTWDDVAGDYLDALGSLTRETVSC